MKMRYYNLIPKIQFSNYLNDFIIKSLFNLAYKKASPIDSKIKKRLTLEFYEEDILLLEKLIEKDLQHWLR